jgi:hypothetical protein
MKPPHNRRLLTTVALLMLLNLGAMAVLKIQTRELSSGAFAPTLHDDALIAGSTTRYRDLWGRRYDHHVVAVVPLAKPPPPLTQLTRRDSNVFLEYDTPYFVGEDHPYWGSISATELTYPPEAQNLFQRPTAQLNGKTYTLRLRARRMH